MDPLRPPYPNAETVPQIRERLRLYRGYNVKFLEYPPDGSSRELGRTDTLDHTLLATTPLGSSTTLSELQQLLKALHYFLFDLQNTMREMVPHGSPVFTLSNVVFCRRYTDGAMGIVLPVQVYNYPRFQISAWMRAVVAATTMEDELDLQRRFVETGSVYLDEVINRIILNFRRRVRDMEIEAQMQVPTTENSSRYRYRPAHGHQQRRHWSMVN